MERFWSVSGSYYRGIARFAQRLGDGPILVPDVARELVQLEGGVVIPVKFESMAQAADGA